MENLKNPPETNAEKKQNLNKWEIVGFAWELGYIIALPIIVLGLLGKWLDEKMGNDPEWITLIAIVVAIALTTFWMTKRLKKYIK